MKILTIFCMLSIFIHELYDCSLNNYNWSPSCMHIGNFYYDTIDSESTSVQLIDSSPFEQIKPRSALVDHTRLGFTRTIKYINFLV